MEMKNAYSIVFYKDNTKAALMETGCKDGRLELILAALNSWDLLTGNQV
jgi:hypothetical protein